MILNSKDFILGTLLMETSGCRRHTNLEGSQVLGQGEEAALVVRGESLDSVTMCVERGDSEETGVTYLRFGLVGAGNGNNIGALLIDRGKNNCVATDTLVLE